MPVESLDDPRRTSPPRSADERATEEAWLEYHRATLLLKVDGLSDEQRRARPVATSLLSLHGLVRHMAEVERNWFVGVIDGQDVSEGLWFTAEHPDGELELLDDAVWADDLAAWRQWCHASREVAARHGLDDTGGSEERPVSLRWVYLHMIEEYARHNGHADLIRELVGGSVGE
jgi:uncharacterized damage-inducible protein DinB